MRTNIDHLPSNKQRELERVTQIALEEFEGTLELVTHQWKKHGRIERLIPYGSYPRGGWVDAPHMAKDQPQTADRAFRLLAEAGRPIDPQACYRPEAAHAGQRHLSYSAGSERCFFMGIEPEDELYWLSRCAGDLDREVYNACSERISMLERMANG